MNFVAISWFYFLFHSLFAHCHELKVKRRGIEKFPLLFFVFFGKKKMFRVSTNSSFFLLPFSPSTVCIFKLQAHLNTHTKSSFLLFPKISSSCLIKVFFLSWALACKMSWLLWWLLLYTSLCCFSGCSPSLCSSFSSLFFFFLLLDCLIVRSFKNIFFYSGVRSFYYCSRFSIRGARTFVSTSFILDTLGKWKLY